MNEVEIDTGREWLDTLYVLIGERMRTKVVTKQDFYDWSKLDHIQHNLEDLLRDWRNHMGLNTNLSTLLSTEEEVQYELE